MFAGGSCLKRSLSNLESLETGSNHPVVTGGRLVLIVVVFTFAESVKFSQAPQDVGANFSFCFRFLTYSLSCIPFFVYFLFSPVFC